MCLSGCIWPILCNELIATKVDDVQPITGISNMSTLIGSSVLTFLYKKYHKFLSSSDAYLQQKNICEISRIAENGVSH